MTWTVVKKKLHIKILSHGLMKYFVVKLSDPDFKEAELLTILIDLSESTHEDPVPDPDPI